MRHRPTLHDLPRFDDKLTYLYIEHAIVEQDKLAVAIRYEDGSTTAIPAASLAVLLLGPGTTLTHAAVKTLADNNCQVLWVGEHGVRFYAQGLGGARNSRNLLRQAFLATQEVARLQVVIRMYCKRFDDKPEPNVTLQQLRGKEGIRVRSAYQQAARQFGVEWRGRNYNRADWRTSDPVNRALSAANSCLYGLCHAAILSGGYSPGLGFIHTGKQLSFVYDVADLYKAMMTIPIAFEEAARGSEDLEPRVRRACRNEFRNRKLIQQILPDIAAVLDITVDDTATEDSLETTTSVDESAPAAWWQPIHISADTPIGQLLDQTVQRPWR